MTLSKRTYVDGETIITARNLNDIQDEIIADGLRIGEKQDTLVSGTNIKTVNNQSLLGEGNITISGGASEWGLITGDITEQEDLQTALNSKQPTGDYATNARVNEVEEEIPTVPTNISAFTNDSGYITDSALEGYATETYVDNHHDSTKQDVISDLEDIRDNASAGKSASDTIATYGDVVTYDADEFATASQGAKADSAVQNLSDLGITTTSTELNYVDGVTSNIQAQLNEKQDTLISGTNIKTINNQNILGEGNITISGGTTTFADILGEPSDNEALSEELNSKLSNNLGVSNAGKILEVNNEGGINPSINSSKLVQTKLVDVNEAYTKEVPALVGLLYKGKRYNPGDTADDGTTITSTARKVTNYIPLSLSGTTYLPLVWGAAGASYTEICLYAGINGEPPSNDAQAVYYTKKSGRQEQTTASTFSLTLIADPNQATYNYDATKFVLKFNPEIVQYVRTFVTDDSTIARAEYNNVYAEERIDVTESVIESIAPLTTPKHQVGCFVGSIYYKNGSSASDGHGIYEIVNKDYKYNFSGTEYVDQQLRGGTITKNVPCRLWPKPIDLKYGGVIINNNLVDTNGAGYAFVAFLDENLNVIDLTEGYTGKGALTVLSNEIIRSNSVSKAVVEEATPSGSTVASLKITVPMSYKYVTASIIRSVTLSYNEAASEIVEYTYINEPAGAQKYRYSDTFLGQQLSDRITSSDITNINHVVEVDAGETIDTVDDTTYHPCHSIADSSVSATSNVKILTRPIPLNNDFEGLSIDATLLDQMNVGIGTITFLNENLEEVQLLDGINGASGFSVLANEVIKDPMITTAQIDSWQQPSTGLNVAKVRVRYPISDQYKYVVVTLTDSYEGSSDDYASDNIQAKYHYIGEYTTGAQKTYTKLLTYIDAKSSTVLNNRYTWSRMYGKNVCLFGGSFATATYGQKAHEYWQEKLNIKLTNYAVGGAGVIQNVGTTPIQTQVTQMINAGEKYDLYILWCSTNDERKVGQKWTSGASQTIEGNTYAGSDFDAEVIGAIDDTARTSQSGGMNWIFNQIYTFDPTAKIIVFNSMRHFSPKLYSGTYAKDDDGYNDLGADAKSSVKHFVDAQNAVCAHWGIPYLDQYNLWGVNTLNKTIFVRSDNLHPTDDGYIRLASKQVELIANV